MLERARSASPCRSRRRRRRGRRRRSPPCVEGLGVRRGWRRAGRRSRSSTGTPARSASGSAPGARAPEQHQRQRRPATSGADGRPGEDRVLLRDAGLLEQSLERRAPGAGPAADLRGRRDVGLVGVVAAQPDRGQRGDADQHPDHPGDHDRSALATPCTSPSVLASSGGVDRGEREPEPEAADERATTEAERWCSVVEAPAGHQPEAERGQHHADGRDHARRERAGSGSRRRARRPAGRPGTRTSTRAAMHLRVGVRRWCGRRSGCRPARRSGPRRRRS